MLRVSDNPPSADGEKNGSHLSIDKKKRQVTLSEPLPTSQSSQSSTQNVNQDRALMVSAPKMFAFDALHTNEDSQVMYQFCPSFLISAHRHHHQKYTSSFDHSSVLHLTVCWLCSSHTENFASIKTWKIVDVNEFHPQNTGVKCRTMLNNY